MATTDTTEVSHPVDMRIQLRRPCSKRSETLIFLHEGKYHLEVLYLKFLKCVRFVSETNWAD